MLSTQIKTLRQGKGWSQAELARRLHISPSAIGMYEQARREPSIETLVALSRAFNVTIDYLVTGTYKVNRNQPIVVEEKQLSEALTELSNLPYENLLILLATEILKKATLPVNNNGNYE